MGRLNVAIFGDHLSKNCILAQSVEAVKHVAIGIAPVLRGSHPKEHDSHVIVLVDYIHEYSLVQRSP